MARAPPPTGGIERRCVCGCRTKNVRTMNKHMKQHSQRLNIKTMKLASLTAIFRSKKKRTPPTSRKTNPPAMDLDEEEHLPGGGQENNSEAVFEGLTLQSDGNETDDQGSDDDDGTSEGMLVDSESEDEFESGEEWTESREGEVETNQRLLEFEVRAAEAGVSLTKQKFSVN